MIIAIGTLASAFNSTLDLWNRVQFWDSGLQLVDVSLKDSYRAATVDITLRNPGEEVAILKETKVHVNQVWVLQPTAVPYPLPSSKNYDITLPLNGAPYDRSKKIKQVVELDGVDRFTLTLHPEDAAFDPNSESHSLTFVFLVTIDLIYNENDRAISTDNLLFSATYMTSPKFYVPKGAPEPEFDQLHAYNKEVAENIHDTEGIKSERLSKLIKGILSG